MQTITLSDAARGQRASAASAHSSRHGTAWALRVLCMAWCAIACFALAPVTPPITAWIQRVDDASGQASVCVLIMWWHTSRSSAPSASTWPATCQHDNTAAFYQLFYGSALVASTPCQHAQICGNTAAMLYTAYGPNSDPRKRTAHVLAWPSMPAATDVTAARSSNTTWPGRALTSAVTALQLFPVQASASQHNVSAALLPRRTMAFSDTAGCTIEQRTAQPACPLLSTAAMDLPIFAAQVTGTAATGFTTTLAQPHMRMNYGMDSSWAPVDMVLLPKAAFVVLQSGSVLGWGRSFAQSWTGTQWKILDMDGGAAPVQVDPRPGYLTRQVTGFSEYLSNVAILFQDGRVVMMGTTQLTYDATSLMLQHWHKAAMIVGGQNRLCGIAAASPSGDIGWQCAGSNTQGAAGAPIASGFISDAASVMPGFDASHMAIGQQFSCALSRPTAELWCVGNTLSAGISFNGAVNVPRRVLLSGEPVALAARDDVVCVAWRTSGVACAGSNAHGLVTPTSTDATLRSWSEMPYVQGVPMPAIALHVGKRKAWAMADDGQVWQWRLGQDPAATPALFGARKMSSTFDGELAWGYRIPAGNSSAKLKGLPWLAARGQLPGMRTAFELGRRSHWVRAPTESTGSWQVDSQGGVAFNANVTLTGSSTEVAQLWSTRTRWAGIKLVYTSTLNGMWSPGQPLLAWGTLLLADLEPVVSAGLPTPGVPWGNFSWDASVVDVAGWVLGHVIYALTSTHLHCWGDCASELALAELPAMLGPDAHVLAHEYAPCVHNSTTFYCWGHAYGMAAAVQQQWNQVPITPIAFQGGNSIKQAAIAATDSGYTDENTVCLLLTSSHVLCAGSDTHGQAGGSASMVGGWHLVATPSGATINDIAGCYQNFCARANGQYVYCWGDNSQMQLGTTTLAGGYTSTPREVMLSSYAIERMTMYPQRVCGVDAYYGLTACTGKYMQALLQPSAVFSPAGVPSTDQVWKTTASPVQLPSTGKYAAMSIIGGYCALALRADGQVLLWGDASIACGGVAADPQEVVRMQPFHMQQFRNYMPSGGLVEPSTGAKRVAAAWLSQAAMLDVSVASEVQQVCWLAESAAEALAAGVQGSVVSRTVHILCYMQQLWQHIECTMHSDGSCADGANVPDDWTRPWTWSTSLITASYRVCLVARAGAVSSHTCWAMEPSENAAVLRASVVEASTQQALHPQDVITIGSSVYLVTSNASLLQVRELGSSAVLRSVALDREPAVGILGTQMCWTISDATIHCSVLDTPGSLDIVQLQGTTGVPIQALTVMGAGNIAALLQNGTLVIPGGPASSMTMPDQPLLQLDQQAGGLAWQQVDGHVSARSNWVATASRTGIRVAQLNLSVPLRACGSTQGTDPLRARNCVPGSTAGVELFGASLLQPGITAQPIIAQHAAIPCNATGHGSVACMLTDSSNALLTGQAYPAQLQLRWQRQAHQVEYIDWDALPTAHLTAQAHSARWCIGVQPGSGFARAAITTMATRQAVPGAIQDDVMVQEFSAIGDDVQTAVFRAASSAAMLQAEPLRVRNITGCAAFTSAGSYSVLQGCASDKASTIRIQIPDMPPAFQAAEFVVRLASGSNAFNCTNPALLASPTNTIQCTLSASRVQGVPLMVYWVDARGEMQPLTAQHVVVSFSLQIYSPKSGSWGIIPQAGLPQSAVLLPAMLGAGTPARMAGKWQTPSGTTLASSVLSWHNSSFVWLAIPSGYGIATLSGTSIDGWSIRLPAAGIQLRYAAPEVYSVLAELHADSSDTFYVVRIQGQNFGSAAVPTADLQVTVDSVACNYVTRISSTELQCQHNAGMFASSAVYVTLGGSTSPAQRQAVEVRPSCMDGTLCGVGAPRSLGLTVGLAAAPDARAWALPAGLGYTTNRTSSVWIHATESVVMTQNWHVQALMAGNLPALVKYDVAWYSNALIVPVMCTLSMQNTSSASSITIVAGASARLAVADGAAQFSDLKLAATWPALSQTSTAQSAMLQCSLESVFIQIQLGIRLHRVQGRLLLASASSKQTQASTCGGTPVVRLQSNGSPSLSMLGVQFTQVSNELEAGLPACSRPAYHPTQPVRCSMSVHTIHASLATRAAPSVLSGTATELDTGGLLFFRTASLYAVPGTDVTVAIDCTVGGVAIPPLYAQVVLPECPVGAVVDLATRRCMACPARSWAPWVEPSDDPRHQCIECPEIIACAGGAIAPEPAVGYWQSTPDSLAAQACKSKVSCTPASPAAAAGANSTARRLGNDTVTAARQWTSGCTPGYAGRMCASCAPGYGMWRGHCMACPDQRWVAIWASLGVAGLVAAVVVFVLTNSISRKSWSPGKRSSRVRISAVQKVLISHCMLLLLATQLELEYPTDVTTFIQTVSTAGSTSSQQVLVPYGCVLQLFEATSLAASHGIRLATPVVVCIACAALWTAHARLAAACAKRHTAWGIVVRRIALTVVLIGHMMLPTMSQQAGSLLVCQTFEDVRYIATDEEPTWPNITSKEHTARVWVVHERQAWLSAQLDTPCDNSATRWVLAGLYLLYLVLVPAGVCWVVLTMRARAQAAMHAIVAATQKLLAKQQDDMVLRVNPIRRSRGRRRISVMALSAQLQQVQAPSSAGKALPALPGPVLQSRRASRAMPALQRVDDAPPSLHLALLAAFDYLTRSYTPECWWYDLAAIGRRMGAAILIVALAPSGLHVQLISVLLLLVLSLGMHLHLAPYRNAVMQRIEMWSLATLCGTYAGAQYFFSPSVGPTARLLLTVGIIVSNSIVLSWLILQYVSAVRQHSAVQKLGRSMGKLHVKLSASLQSSPLRALGSPKRAGNGAGVGEAVELEAAAAAAAAAATGSVGRSESGRTTPYSRVTTAQHSKRTSGRPSSAESNAEHTRSTMVTPPRCYTPGDAASVYGAPSPGGMSASDGVCSSPQIQQSVSPVSGRSSPTEFTAGATTPPAIPRHGTRLHYADYLTPTPGVDSRE